MNEPLFALKGFRWLAVSIGTLATIAACLSVLAMPPSQPSPPQVPEELPDFDGQRAFGYLLTQCRLGARPTGSATSLELYQRIVRHFEQDEAWHVSSQPFYVLHPRNRRSARARNIIASYAPERRTRVLIGAHYDTRPFADMDVNPRPYIGANDGASGVAALMELRHHIPSLDLRVGVDLVFFDAEELVYGVHPTESGEYCLGSRWFARRWLRSPNRPTYRAAVILDMVAGKDAEFYPEEHSVLRAPHIVRQVWDVAASIEARRFRTLMFRRWKHSVYDDHVPLQEAGIPAIDIIDFDYPHWHRNTDVPENCSAETLDEVGTVVLTWLKRHFGNPKPATSQ